MNGTAYERLAEGLDRLANGFPRTESGVELRILAHVFTPEEAEIAAALSSRPSVPSEIAQRVGMEPEHVAATLERLAGRSVIWTMRTEERVEYRLAPFLPVGFYEAHSLEEHDPAYARLVEEYLCNGGAAGIMGPQPALHRVVPARAAVDTEWVMPYDDVRTLLEAAVSFRLETCVCRLQQEELGARVCDFPLDACLWFSYAEGSGEGHQISRDEALEVLDKAERVGLVHTVSNVAQGIGYVCNCCGCCCGLLRGINEWGVEHSVAQANYYAEIDPDRCAGCGDCVERCQVAAVAVSEDGVAVVSRATCIGCGLCVTGCPEEAASLCRKPAEEVVPPPATSEAWERLRLRARGIDAESA